jgi:effector-binding domain-containing protein
MSLAVEIVEVKAQPGLAVTIKTSQEDIGEDMGKAYGAVAAYMGKAGAQFAGPPFAIYGTVPGEMWTVVCGFPVAGSAKGEGDIQAMETPAGKAAMTMHVGAYETLKNTWNAFAEWMKENGHEMDTLGWEVYLTDQETEPDTSKWQTQLFWSV